MNEPRSSISDQEIHAYVDGTLPEERRDLVDEMLEKDAALAATVSDYFSLNNMLHDRYDRVLSESVPVRLKPKVRRSWWRQAANWPQFAGMAATLAMGIGVGIGYSALQHHGDEWAGRGADTGNVTPAKYTDNGTNFAQQAAVAHVVYSPDTQHPVEIGRDREQELVTWLSGRIGMNVKPPSLAGSGFQLIGGRLLPGTDGPIAQFMYNDASGERITLCISRRKVATNTTAFRLYQDGPVNVFYWVDGDIGYAVSGGIDRNTLLGLAHDVYAQLTDVVNSKGAASNGTATQ
jgi:anti-sigma factor RsiW